LRGETVSTTATEFRLLDYFRATPDVSSAATSARFGLA